MTIDMVVLEIREGHKERTIDVLHFYVIDDPVQVGGSVIVVQSVSELPDLRGLTLPPAIEVAISDGSMGFEVARMRVRPGVPDPQVVQMIQGAYADRKQAFNDAYQARFMHFGMTLSAS